MRSKITSVRFSAYKGFKDFSLSLGPFNILVGPNNAGKSTILGAFRILAEAMRKARAKSATFVQGPDGDTWGYDVNLVNVPVATENVFHNYDGTHLPVVKFRTSAGNSLILFFPRPGTCTLICETAGKSVKTPADFRRTFDLEIGFVPTLGPVEHNEQLYNKETAREALLSHGASRNFRNIWHHYPENFNKFSALIRDTWPGMDVKLPEIDTSHDKPLLWMFCPEERRDREIYWAGFGFQVWCQMLTYMVANTGASLFVIDEPDIYLHSDLQRQLINELRVLGPDILIATHSTEMLYEAEDEDILLITKSAKSGRRVAAQSELRTIFDLLGSAAKPVLTQIAKSSKIVFVEGRDFSIISKFAAKLGAKMVAKRSAFAIVPAGGFSPQNVKLFKEGVEASVGAKVTSAVLFDRDYRSQEEVERQEEQLRNFNQYAHIHTCKEIENFLLVPLAIVRAIEQRSNGAVADAINTVEKIEALLLHLSEQFKIPVQAQYLKHQHANAKSLQPNLDDSTVTVSLLTAFETKWLDLNTRLKIVPGKELLARLNTHLQTEHSISLTSRLRIDSMTEGTIPLEMKLIIAALENFADPKAGVRSESTEL